MVGVTATRLKSTTRRTWQAREPGETPVGAASTPLDEPALATTRGKREQEHKV